MSVLLSLDIFGVPVNLNIQSNSRSKTMIGGSLSILAIILLFIHAYFEFEEVITKDNPFITYHKEDLYYFNLSQKFSNKTFPFYFTAMNWADMDSDVLQFFNVQASFSLSYSFNKTTIKKFEVTMEACNKDDADFLKSICPDFTFPKNLLNTRCIRGIDYELYTNYSNFVVSASVSISECEDGDNTCRKNEDLYEKIYKKEINLSFELNIFEPRVNLYGYKNPIVYNLRNFKKFTKIDYPNRNNLNIQLSSLQITTKRDMIFNTDDAQSSYYVKKFENLEDSSSFANFALVHDRQMEIYVRNYKTFTSALAGTFSVFKLYLLIFFQISSYFAKFNEHKIIIDKNFEYNENKVENISKQNLDYKVYHNEESIINPNDNNLIEKISPIMRDNENKHLNCKNKTKFKFSFCSKIALYLTCRVGKSREFRFYNSAVMIINKNLSVEKIFKNLIEQKRLKMFILNKQQLFLFDNMNRIIINEAENDNLFSKRKFNYSEYISFIDNNTSVSEKEKELLMNLDKEIKHKYNIDI